MSTLPQTIEPDDPTVSTNSQPQAPARSAEPQRPVLGAIAGSTSPGDTEAGTVLLSPRPSLDTRTHQFIDAFEGLAGIFRQVRRVSRKAFRKTLAHLILISPRTPSCSSSCISSA